MDVVALHFDAERLERRIAHAARSFKSSHGHRVGCDRGITGIDHRRVQGVVVEVRHGCLHNDPGLVFGVRCRLERRIDCRHGRQVDHRVGGPGALQRSQNRRRIAQRLIDQQVGDRAGLESKTSEPGLFEGLYEVGIGGPGGAKGGGMFWAGSKVASTSSGN